MNKLEQFCHALAPQLVDKRAGITQDIVIAVLARQDTPNAVDVEHVTRQADEFARRIIETQISGEDVQDWAANTIMSNLPAETVTELLGEETTQ